MLVKGAETAVLNQLASGPGDVTLDHVNEYAEVCMQTLIPGCPDEIYCLQDYSLRHKERKKKRKKRTDWQTDTDRRDRQTDRHADRHINRQTDRQNRETDGRTDWCRAGEETNRPTEESPQRKKEGRKKDRKHEKSKETYASFHDCRICTKARVEIRLLSVFTFLPKTPTFTI